VYIWDVESSVFSLQSSVVFIYDGWNLITELTEVSGQIPAIRSHVWGLDLSGTEQGAGGVGGLLFTTSHLPLASSHFACFDGNGNVTALVDTATGTLAAAYEYDPFGNIIARIENPASSIQNPFLFSTKYTDAETGLLYYGYRYYQPSTGRWLSRDPIGESGGVGIYVFVTNNSINLLDVLGDNPFGEVFDEMLDTIREDFYNLFESIAEWNRRRRELNTLYKSYPEAAKIHKWLTSHPAASYRKPLPKGPAFESPGPKQNHSAHYQWHKPGSLGATDAVLLANWIQLGGPIVDPRTQEVSRHTHPPEPVEPVFVNPPNNGPTVPHQNKKLYQEGVPPHNFYPKGQAYRPPDNFLPPKGSALVWGALTTSAALEGFHRTHEDYPTIFFIINESGCWHIRAKRWWEEYATVKDETEAKGELRRWFEWIHLPIPESLR
jgi:RHS repeat-associated protein